MNSLMDIFLLLVMGGADGCCGRKIRTAARLCWASGPGSSARAERRDNGGMLKSQMKISLVVPAFNEERLLPGSLSSMRAAMQGFARLGWHSERIPAWPRACW